MSTRAKHTEAIQSADKWVTLLKDRAKISHSTELASSSILSLADTLTGLMVAYKDLSDECGDYHKRVNELERRLAKKEPIIVKKEGNGNAA